MTIFTVSRRGLLATGAAALATPLVLSRARAQDKFVCKIAHTEGIGTPITNAFEAWAKVLNEQCGGRIDAQHFPAAQLGGLAELLEGSRIGTIQATTAGPDSRGSHRARDRRLRRRAGLHLQERGACRPRPAGRAGPEGLRHRPRQDRRRVRRLRRDRLPPHPVEDAGGLACRPQGPEDPRAAAADLGRLLDPARLQRRRPCPTASSIRPCRRASSTHSIPTSSRSSASSSTSRRRT